MAPFSQAPMPPVAPAQISALHAVARVVAGDQRTGNQRISDQRTAQTELPPHKAPLKRPAGVMLHHLLIAQLDPDQGEYTTADLARLLGVGLPQMSKRIRAKFPREEGEPREVHRLDFRRAVLMIRLVCCDGKKLPDLDQLFCDLVLRGVIDLDFPTSNVAVQMAERIFSIERERLLHGYQR